MELLYIDSDIDSPEIIFDPENNKFEIKGRSLLINAVEFYAPVIEWLEEYIKAPNKSTCFDVTLEYLNSSTVRKLVEIFVLLETLMENGYDIKVNWYYYELDEIIMEKGEEIKSVVYLPFNIIEIASE
ncbi:MAG: nuclear pore complex subunit [Bacteroidia bacterium]|nr:MAG: nuclear pore complex subunit [Bacteroidia bacterium]